MPQLSEQERCKLEIKLHNHLALWQRQLHLFINLLLVVFGYGGLILGGIIIGLVVLITVTFLIVALCNKL